MATALKLRNTTTNGITDTGDGTLFDMVDAFGAGSDTCVTNTAASGTEIQLTKTAGGSTVAWISGRTPAGGFTLTTTDISVWQIESNMNANAAGRYRVFKRTAAGSVSEVAGGPFNDDVEMNTTIREDTWAGNVTDTAFAENDRILLRLYLTNAPTLTMGGAFNCTHTFNAASATTGDSFFNIAETIAFKANSVITEADGSSAGAATSSVAGVAITMTVGNAPGAATVLADGENAAPPSTPVLSFNNYLFVRVGEGMGCSERIR